MGSPAREWLLEKQALVIGLGQFGMALSRSLKKLGVEVICVDAKESLVEVASHFADEAVCLDAASEDALARLAPASRDICVCAIGDESREGAILVTALLRQMGAKRVIARGGDELLSRILSAVGAHELVNPEQAFGERLAPRLVYGTVLDEVALDEHLVVTTLEVPGSMVGRNLIELELPRRFGVTVAAIRRADAAGAIAQPDPRRALEAGDVLVVVSSHEAIRKLITRW